MEARQTLRLNSTHPGSCPSRRKKNRSTCTRNQAPTVSVARIFEAWFRREIESYMTVYLIDWSIRANRRSGVRFYSSMVFSDTQNTYVPMESRGVFYGPGKTKRERDTAFYLCKRLNSWRRSIPRRGERVAFVFWPAFLRPSATKSIRRYAAFCPCKRFSGREGSIRVARDRTAFVFGQHAH